MNLRFCFVLIAVVLFSRDTNGEQIQVTRPVVAKDGSVIWVPATINLDHQYSPVLDLDHLKIGDHVLIDLRQTAAIQFVESVLKTPLHEPDERFAVSLDAQIIEMLDGEVTIQCIQGPAKVAGEFMMVCLRTKVKKNQLQPSTGLSSPLSQNVNEKTKRAVLDSNRLLSYPFLRVTAFDDGFDITTWKLASTPSGNTEFR